MRGEIFKSKNSKKKVILYSFPFILIPLTFTIQVTIEISRCLLYVQVNSILRNVASKLNYDNQQLESLHERTAWALEDKTGIPSSSYNLFKKAVT